MQDKGSAPVVTALRVLGMLPAFIPKYFSRGNHPASSHSHTVLLQAFAVLLWSWQRRVAHLATAVTSVSRAFAFLQGFGVLCTFHWIAITHASKQVTGPLSLLGSTIFLLFMTKVAAENT